MKNKSTSRFLLAAIVCFIFFMSIENLIAQEKGIYEIFNKTRLTNKISKSSSKSVLDDRQSFYKLAFNLNTTLYLKNNQVLNSYGEGPIKKITISDLKSFDILKNNAKNYQTVELITINVKSKSELNGTIDLTGVTEMTSLKYVFIRCSFKCRTTEVENLIKASPNVRVFYYSGKPS